MKKIILLVLLAFISIACKYEKGHTSLLGIPVNVDDGTDDANTCLYIYGERTRTIWTSLHL